MNPLRSELPVVYLEPGEVFASGTPVVITTTLGSCVSVIFFSRRHRFGAICHALLPSGEGQEKRFKYLDNAFHWMLEQFRRRGIKMEEIQVKLFGGADVLQYVKTDFQPATVGQQNIDKALELVKGHRLKLSASNLGGAVGRKIFFYTDSGKVLVKQVGRIC